MGNRVTPSGPSTMSKAPSDYCSQLHYKHSRELGPGQEEATTTDDGMKRLKDVGDKGTLITAAELGLVDQYREMANPTKLDDQGKLPDKQEILTYDVPYRYSSILYACYGNQYKILQLVEREFCRGDHELLTHMHSFRCWMGKNSAMVAAYQGHLETMLYIVDLDLQGKFVEADGRGGVQAVDLFKQTDIMGKTAMAWAASQGHTDTIEVLVVRSLYKLLPADSTDPLVLKTRWRLACLLSDLSAHCVDYDKSGRRFFSEVLSSIKYDPAAAAAAEAMAEAEATREGAALQDPDDPEDDDDEEGKEAKAKAAKRAAKNARSDSVIVKPSGLSKDVHITVRTLQGVIVSAHRAGMNCMGVIMYCQSLLQQAKYFDDLVVQLTAWEVKLLDTCRNKIEVQAVLTPTEEDPSEPVGYALATFDKAFLSHKFIQQIFTEKWDTMGVTDYTHNLFGLMWCMVAFCFAFGFWAIVCPITIILRSFLPSVQAFLQRGKIIVDSRFPWHVPLYRWLLTQGAFITFTVLLSYQVFTTNVDATLESATAPLATFLAIWCFAMLVEEVQEYLEEGRAEYMSQGWNIMDVAMALAYLLHYFLRIITVMATSDVKTLLVVNDLLAAASLMSWFRLVSVFELSSAIGPLIQMMKQMILQDVTRFALLVVVILLGFSVGMEALFQEVCLARDPTTQECTQYSAWSYDWQKQGLIGGMTFLQYVALGSASPTDFEQKRVTGIIFYLIFAVVTSILLLNLFIAMLADTYTRVSTKAQVEFRYRKAKIMASFSRREAICPPFNLLHLVFGFLGNSLRRLVVRGDINLVSLRKNEAVPLFSWYFPQGKEAEEVRALQKRVVEDFLQSNRVALFKEKLNADLPNLVHNLVKHQKEDVFRVRMK